MVLPAAMSSQHVGVQMGTIAWAAPELLRNFRIGSDQQHRAITHKADVFRYLQHHPHAQSSELSLGPVV